jgi:hypothetical protein
MKPALKIVAGAIAGAAVTAAAFGVALSQSPKPPAHIAAFTTNIT